MCEFYHKDEQSTYACTDMRKYVNLRVFIFALNTLNLHTSALVTVKVWSLSLVKRLCYIWKENPTMPI